MRYEIEAKTLVFKQPAGTSRGVYTERRLWYVHLYDSDAAGNVYHGIGECAPLHDLSCDYRDDMAALLDEACRSLVACGEIDYKTYADCPSVLFALETALLSLQGSRRGDALKLWDNAFTCCEQGIPINGLVWMGSYDEMMKRMTQKLAQGFRCIKVKIGAIDFDKELSLLTHLRQRFAADKIELRVDANGGFSADEAPDKLRALARLDIHSIEQPIRQHQWDAMARLCHDTPIPIALDEELIGVNSLEEKRLLLDTIRPQYIILKPTLHGGLKGCEQWMAEARRRGIGYWVTSALESNVGLNAIAQWAAHTGNTEMPQGLGTGQLFTTNFDSVDLEILGDRLWYRSERQRTFEREARQFIDEWNSDTRHMAVTTSGSTGDPKTLLVEKERMRASARMTLRALGLKAGDTALLCMPLKYIAGKMVVVRALTGRLRLIVTAPSSRPFRTLTTSPTFAALTPMQAVESLEHAHDAALMRGVRQLIIGGGAIPPTLEAELRHFPNAVWSTYGMTETLSHIALRRLSGAEASLRYSPCQGVGVSLNGEGCLQINAPALCDEPLTTNDLAELHPDGTFTIVGRRDNVVCSGGIKLHIEKIEERLRAFIDIPFMLTSADDPRLGEALTLLYVGGTDARQYVENACRNALDPYEVPRHFLAVNALPLTETGKPARKRAKLLAANILKGS